MIERRPDPIDSRAKLIDFTDKGKNLTAELAQSTEAVWRQYEDILGKKQMRSLYQGLQTLIGHSEGEFI